MHICVRAPLRKGLKKRWHTSRRCKQTTRRRRTRVKKRSRHRKVPKYVRQQIEGAQPAIQHRRMPTATYRHPIYRTRIAQPHVPRGRHGAYRPVMEKSLPANPDGCQWYLHRQIRPRCLNPRPNGHDRFPFSWSTGRHYHSMIQVKQNTRVKNMEGFK